MKKQINVLSLFDGMSCGQIALKELNIKINTYYASEIDKHAIAQTQLNFPSTIQLGSVTEIDVSKLKPIELLIGGSPCQSFSFAGKRNGMTTSCNEEIYTLERYLELKADGFQFEGESYLFWEYMRILTDIRKYNPDVLFLLENVEMGAKWERVLSEAIGVYGVHINSALVSAQNRKRIYWTNIRVREEGLFGELHSDIPQPEDRGILLKDILEDEVDEKYYITSKSMMNFITDEWRLNKKYTQINGEKAIPQLARQYSSWGGDYVCVAMRGRGENNEQTLEPQLSGKTNTLTSVQKDNLVMQLNPSKESGGRQPYQPNRYYDINGISPCLNTDARSPAILIPEATSKGYVEIEPGECFDAENINSKTRRGRKMVNKSNCLMAKETDFMRYEAVGCDYRSDEGFRFRDNGKSGTLAARARNDESCGQLALITTPLYHQRIRRLTPTECARLQTIPDWYIWECSDTQQYKMLGNGWTVEIIKHILKHL